MDLTPQTLRDVEFREKLRGYHPDDVDDFLEAAAVALEELLSRLQVAESSAAAVVDVRPAVVQPAPVAAEASDVSEDTLRRTLLLAQRTADAAIADAEESARKLLDTATSEANRVMAEAEAKAATTTREVRARTESAVADLEQRRIGLEREVAALQSWATQQRDRLRDVLSDQMRALDIWLATSGTPRPLGGRGTPVVSHAPAEKADEEPPEPSLVDVRSPDDAVEQDETEEGDTSAAVSEPDDGEEPVDLGDGGPPLGGRVIRRK